MMYNISINHTKFPKFLYFRPSPYVIEIKPFARAAFLCEMTDHYVYHSLWISRLAIPYPNPIFGLDAMSLLLCILIMSVLDTTDSWIEFIP